MMKRDAGETKRIAVELPVSLYEQPKRSRSIK